MKLSEFKKHIDWAYSRAQYDNDLTVVVSTRNGGVPTYYKAPIVRASIGGDWDRNFFILHTEHPIVSFKTTESTPGNLGRTRLERLKEQHDKIGQKYIMKAREHDWLEGYIEGFRAFTIAVQEIGKP